MEKDILIALKSESDKMITNIIEKIFLEQEKRDKMHYKIVVAFAICIIAITVLFSTVIIYKDYQAYNYEGGSSVENSYNGSSSGNNSTVNNGIK